MTYLARYALRGIGLAAVALPSVFGLAGCTPAKGTVAAPPPPTVLVSTPIVRPVSDFEDFVGQTMAVKTIDIRARVNGFLDKVGFEDGSEVAQDTVLCMIDPRPFEAEVARTEAALNQAEAHNKRLENDYRRAQSLLARDALPRQDFDLTAGDYAESGASVGIARANLNLAKLNLSFCKVTAPISGRLSRRLIDPGNLVMADTTILTSIVSLDPMYVYFDIDERTLLRIRRLINEGKVKSRTEAEVPVLGSLADETDFTHHGLIDFSDNKLDPNTGTLRVRAVLQNPKPRVYSPGMFMKIRLPVGQPYNAMLVPEEAVGSDQGARYLYVVDAKKTVVQRPITTGNLYFQKYRAVESGIAAGDQVIVSGLQRVRPGLLVDPKPMPPIAMLTDTKAVSPGEIVPPQPTGGPAKPADPKADAATAAGVRADAKKDAATARDTRTPNGQ